MWTSDVPRHGTRRSCSADATERGTGPGVNDMRMPIQGDKAAGRPRTGQGTFRRIAGFAAPYRLLLAALLTLIVATALSETATPLIFRGIIDDGILKHNADTVLGLALVMALLAFADAGLQVWQRRVSAR